MIEKWKRELLCGGEGILTQLGVLAAAGGVGMGLALFLCLANHFEEYFTAGPILQIVIVSFCALLGYQDMVCRFNRAVSFQESRRGFLAAYLPVEYALLAAQLVLINVWSFLEQAVESRLIGGTPAFPPFRIGVDVQDDADFREEAEKTVGVLAGFGEKELMGPYADISVDCLENTAYGDGGVRVGRHEDMGRHGGCGGFSVGTGYSDGNLIVFHKLSQKLGAGEHGKFSANRLGVFGIIRVDSGSIDHKLRVLGDVRGPLAVENFRAHVRQQSSSGAGPEGLQGSRDFA